MFPFFLEKSPWSMASSTAMENKNDFFIEFSLQFAYSHYIQMKTNSKCQDQVASFFLEFGSERSFSAAFRRDETFFKKWNNVPSVNYLSNSVALPFWYFCSGQELNAGPGHPPDAMSGDLCKCCTGPHTCYSCLDLSSACAATIFNKEPDQQRNKKTIAIFLSYVVLNDSPV